MTSTGENQLQAVLLTNTGNVPLRVLSLGRERALVRMPYPVRLPNKVRIGFAHHGKHPGRILVLATVTSMQDQQESMMLKLDYLALHSMDGQECITEFVTRDLGRPSTEDAGFSYGRGGWFYSLSQQDAAAPQQTDEAQGASLRREERIPVRVPIAYINHGRRTSGQTYNISYHGLFVLTEEMLPANGDTLEIAYETPVGFKDELVVMHGLVCWTGAGMNTALGGGIGIQIVDWRSPEDASSWKAYVTRELEFMGSRKNS
jgi:hypothetical protein